MKKLKHFATFLLALTLTFLTACSQSVPQDTFNQIENSLNANNKEKLVQNFNFEDPSLDRAQVDEFLTKSKAYRTTVVDEFNEMVQFIAKLDKDQDPAELEFDSLDYKLYLEEVYPDQEKLKDTCLAKVRVDVLLKRQDQDDRSLTDMMEEIGKIGAKEEATTIVGLKRIKGKWLVSPSVVDEFSEEEVQTLQNNNANKDS